MIDVWETLESAFPVIIGNLRAAEKDVPEHPIQQIEGWGRLMDFLLFENQAINGKLVTENLSRRAYMSPETMDRQYQNLVEHGYATENDGLFSITDAGRDAYLDFFAQRAKAYATVTLLPDGDYAILIDFLKKGYEVGKVADLPEHKPSMGLAYEFYSNIGGGQLGTLLGWINLFELYRDDVHAAMWRHAGYTGIQIETYTQVWRGEAHNASELAKKLAFRGYSEADYQQALDDLVDRTALSLENGNYSLPDYSVKAREQIEYATNQLFDDFCAATYSEQDLADFERVIKAIKQV